MANWIDFFSLIVVITLFGGAIYGVLLVTRLISESMESTKESLKGKGLDISKSGVSVKTSKRFDRDDYVDATQRGFVKAMGAASFGRANDMDSTSKKSPALPRRDSASSLNDTDEKKKRGVFGMRKAFSKEKA